MKYLRIFLSIFFLVVFAAISFGYLTAAPTGIMVMEEYFFSPLVLIIPTLFFFIYLLLIKDNYRYFSVFSLAFMINVLIITAIFTLSTVSQGLKIDDVFEVGPLGITVFMSIVLRILFAIGLFILFLYFRGKYLYKSEKYGEQVIKKKLDDRQIVPPHDRRD